MKQVLVSQRYLAHYRVPFFERLSDRLKSEQILLRVAAGNPAAFEKSRRDEGVISWPFQTASFYLGQSTVCYQVHSNKFADVDLAIFPAENRLLHVYKYLLFRNFKRIALWGHGKNTSDPTSHKEILKRFIARRAHHCFAYSKSARQAFLDSGVSGSKITVLNNSIDQESLKSAYVSVSEKEKISLRQKYGCTKGHTAMCISTLSSEKRLDELIAHTAPLYSQDPLFRLVVCGDGPHRKVVENAASYAPWVVLRPAVFDKDKALHLSIADVLAHPGTVGLSVFDSFSTGIPMVAMHSPYQTPEFDYLEHGVNSFIVNGFDQFINCISLVLYGQTSLDFMRVNAVASGNQYSLHNMVDNFAKGVMLSLES